LTGARAQPGWRTPNSGNATLPLFVASRADAPEWDEV